MEPWPPSSTAPPATAIGNDGTLYTTIWSLVPGLADIVDVP